MSMVDDEEAIEDAKLVVAVTLGNALLTSLGKYILGLATGSALARVETAASAVTKIDFVCILQILWPMHPCQNVFVFSFRQDWVACVIIEMGADSMMCPCR